MTAIIIAAGIAALAAPSGEAAAPSPLVGTWIQERGFHCSGWGRAGPDSWKLQAPSPELVFTAAGRFTVTYEPFESFVDYWGTWRADRDGSLVLDIEDSNSTTDGLDPEGRWELAPDGRLHLTDMWLGGRQGHGCGAIFVRARTAGPLAPVPAQP